MDALAVRGDEGRWSLRKALVRWQPTVITQRCPNGGTQPHKRLSRTEYIGVWRRTRGTETSKYPEEKKSNEIPLVAASERGLAEQYKLVEQSGKSGDTG